MTRGNGLETLRKRTLELAAQGSGMSASTRADPMPPAPPAGAADPSMEDILASIRRILSEDEAAAVPAAAVPEPAVEPPYDDDVLSLESSMLVDEPPAEPPVAPRIVPDPPPLPPAPVFAPPAALPATPAAFDDELLGPAAAAAASSSLGALVRTLADRQGVAVYRGGPTLEDIVRDEMRPLLRAWLDENLPPLVERLVRAEIERVVGRAVS